MAKNVIIDVCQIFNPAMCTDRRQIDFLSTECSLSKLVSNTSSDSSTILKICDHIKIVVKKQQISLKDSEDASAWIINHIRNKNTTDVKKMISTLQCVLKLLNPYTPKLYDELLGDNGLIWIFLKDDSALVDTDLELLKCLQTLILFPENFSSKEQLVNQNILNKCRKISISKLYANKKNDCDEILLCETAIIAFKLLIQSCSIDNDLTTYLSDIIGVCRFWMIYPFEVNNHGCAQRAVPSQQTLADISHDQPVKGGKRIKLRKTRNKKPIDICKDEEKDSNNFQYSFLKLTTDFNKLSASMNITSESDTSDSESSLQNKISAMQAKVRLAALNLLTVTLQTSDRHIVFGYWWIFLPDNRSVPNQFDKGGLALSLSKETNQLTKMASFTSLLSLLTASRTYLMQADTSKHVSMAFTPFSVALGISLENIHSLFDDRLSKERSPPVLVALLKCIAALVQATPYVKLGTNLLDSIVHKIKNLVVHKDWTVQVVSLIVMGCIVCINPPCDKVAAMLMNNSGFCLNCTADNSKDVNDQISWLVQVCSQNLGWKYINSDIAKCLHAAIPTKQESLQLLSTLSLQYFDMTICPIISNMEKILSAALEDPSIEVCLHAAKCVSSVGEAMQKSERRSDKLIFECFVSFWSSLLNGALTKLLQNDNFTSARAVACGCIGTIGEEVFIRLEENQRILAATLLLGLSNDEDIQVKASAIRSVGVCIMYQLWREDIGILTDCCEMALRAIEETSLSVKVKAIWTLANITDALIINNSNPEVEMPDDKLFFRITSAAINCSHANDKIKMNAMRTMGNMLYLSNNEHFSKSISFKNTVKDGLSKLKQSAKHGNNMKVRWNACHSLGKALKNRVLYDYFNFSQDEIFECLCDIIQTCRNLKVRIHASAALSSPSTRSHYGASFPAIWDSIMKTLSDISHTDDFLEYEHKNFLIEQLCVTLSHLACLLTNEDLSDILNSLCFHWEMVAHSIQQVTQKCEPQSESCQKLLNAAKYVTTELSSLNEKQQQSISILQNIFIWDY